MYLVIQFVPFLGWLSDVFSGVKLSDLQFRGYKGHGLNHLLGHYRYPLNHPSN